LPSGIIIKGIGGFYYVKTQDGLFECKPRGIFRKSDITPLPGDKVSITVIDESRKLGNIDEIKPRETFLIRPAVANINQVAVVLAVRSPAPDLVLMDKLLITAELKGIDAVICLNKIDLDTEGVCSIISEEYKKANYRVVELSSKANKGFDFLHEVLCGRITVFAGQSGVGKSTILNRILNSWVMETGDVSRKIERGRHTTRHAELLELECGGYVVDTPGFSSFELTDISHDELERYYREFSDFVYKCRFSHCSHVSEPGCCVKEALASGLISHGRYERYVQVYNTLKEKYDNIYKK